MYKKRIIPCLDMYKGKVVKGVNFVDFKTMGDPVALATEYSASGADELVLLDISATVEGRQIMLDVVKNVADVTSIPLIVGGGLASMEDIESVFLAGADKVSINSAAIKNPRLIMEVSKEYGSDKLVVAIDIKQNNDSWDVYINGGQNNTHLDAVAWARECEKLGAGEILLTSMDRDGTRSGFDIAATKAVAEAVKIPVIASGGAGTLQHFREAIEEGKASGVLAASLFHTKEVAIDELRSYL